MTELTKFQKTGNVADMNRQEAEERLAYYAQVTGQDPKEMTVVDKDNNSVKASDLLDKLYPKKSERS